MSAEMKSSGSRAKSHGRWMGVLVVSSVVMLLMLLVPPASYSQTCIDYCTQGYVTLDPSQQSSICFSIPTATYSSKVCLSHTIQLKPGSGCSGDQWINVAIYNQAGNYAAPQNCA